MSSGDLIGVIGVIITVISLGYALWEKRSRTRLEDFVRAQNWAMYEKASNANGHTQLALAKYKSLQDDSFNPEVLEYLSKADAFGQDVFKETIRQIRYSEPHFDHDAIDRWIREGRISENHAPHFHKLAPASQTRSQTEASLP